MLEIVIPPGDGWDPKKEMFVPIGSEVKLKLEHSLLSLAKWESRWHKPFLSTERTHEENIDYIKCMTINQHVDPSVYDRLTRENLIAINNYINDDATATKFYELMKPSKKSASSPPCKKKIQTSETIYASMIELGIPIDFEKRHLNHLLTLIKVCQERATPSKPMSKADRLAWQRAENERRLAKMKTRG